MISRVAAPRLIRIPSFTAVIFTFSADYATMT